MAEIFLPLSDEEMFARYDALAGVPEFDIKKWQDDGWQRLITYTQKESAMNTDFNHEHIIVRSVHGLVTTRAMPIHVQRAVVAETRATRVDWYLYKNELKKPGEDDRPIGQDQRDAYTRSVNEANSIFGAFVAGMVLLEARGFISIDYCADQEAFVDQHLQPATTNV